MVFNATFNNVSDISWWSVLLAEKTTDLPQVPIRSNPPLSYKYLNKKGGVSFKISVKNRKWVSSQLVNIVIFYYIPFLDFW